MSAPAALPVGAIPFRLSRTANNISVAPRHLSKREPLPFGDSPHIRAMLEKPTWSVRSLMPEELRSVEKKGPLEKKLSSPPALSSANTNTATINGKERINQAKSIEADEGITPEKLRHLLRLSALPPPKNTEEESRMLRDLRNQIHFVKQIQKVDTTGVEPLVAIRDETREHVETMTFKLEDMKPWLDMEEKVGKGEFLRVRRPRDVKVKEMEWDPFAMGVGSEEGSGRRWGRYFVVKKGGKRKRDGARGKEDAPP